MSCFIVDEGVTNSPKHLYVSAQDSTVPGEEVRGEDDVVVVRLLVLINVGDIAFSCTRQ